MTSPATTIRTTARRAIKWQMLSHGPARACSAMAAALKASAMPEEEIGGELLDTLCAMIRSGEVDCSTVTSDRRAIRIGGETVVALVTPLRH